MAESHNNIPPEHTEATAALIDPIELAAAMAWASYDERHTLYMHDSGRIKLSTRDIISLDNDANRAEQDAAEDWYTKNSVSAESLDIDGEKGGKVDSAILPEPLAGLGFIALADSREAPV